MAQINKPNQYFNTNLYTGNNTETSHTVGFQPDLTWLKVRNASGAHYWFDAVRGATNYIRSDNTAAEGTLAETLKSFDTNGYTVGTSNSVNTTNETMVGWNWLADNTSGSANTDGSISSTVSANTTSGFSIVTYTGTGATGTIGHGLNTAPSCIITKSASAAEDWGMYHVGMGNDRNISLNLTNAQYSSNSAFWNNTNPTSSVFTVGTHPTINYNTQTMIAYCFAEKKGFSKFGSYTGNGSSDGTFVYTGFKPAFVMVKRTDVAEGWGMFDDKRDIFNPVMKRVEANASDAERTDLIWYDFYSNGFKPRQSYDLVNASGGTYIYMAFAENPIVGTNNIPTTAR